MNAWRWMPLTCLLAACPVLEEEPSDSADPDALSCRNPDGSGKSAAHGDIICELDESSCADGKDYDFECDAEQCRCIVGDAVVSSAVNPGVCTGDDRDADILELANELCGWSLVYDDDSSDTPAEDEDGDDDSPSCGGRCDGEQLGTCRCSTSCGDGSSAELSCTQAALGAQPTCACTGDAQLCAGSAPTFNDDACTEFLHYCQGGCAFPQDGSCTGGANCADGWSGSMECPPGAASLAACQCKQGESSIPCDPQRFEQAFSCCDR